MIAHAIEQVAHPTSHAGSVSIIGSRIRASESLFYIRSRIDAIGNIL